MPLSQAARACPDDIHVVEMRVETGENVVGIVDTDININFYGKIVGLKPRTIRCACLKSTGK